MEMTKSSSVGNPLHADNTQANRLTDSGLTAAEHPLAIRLEHVVEAETYLRVEERSNIVGPSDFIASLASGTTALSAHGKGALFAKKQEIRDASGLPIFELHKTSMVMQNAFHLELPGRSRDRLLEVDLHGASGGKLSLQVRFVNKYARDGALVRSQAQSDSTIDDAVVEVRGQDMERINFDVFHLGAKVARIGRVVPKIIKSKGSRERPAWEATVSENVDLTIVSILQGCNRDFTRTFGLYLQIFVSIIALADTLLRRSAPAAGGAGALAIAGS